MQRDQNVTLIYESAGLYLTIRGKALDGGTEGDVVSVLNLQSKRTVSGVVIGRGQVAISVATPRLPAADRSHPPPSDRPRPPHRSRSPPATVRQSLQKPSKVHVHVQYSIVSLLPARC